jgi:DedD protein
MPIFSTRSSKKGEDQAPTKNVPIDSIETLRTRARQRLIGAVVLVALGIVAFTLLFDSQPRPIPVDIQITMPDKDKPDSTVTATIPASATPVTAAPATSSTPQVATPPAPAIPSAAAPAAAATAAVQASASLSAKEEIVAPKTDKSADKKLETKPETKAETKAKAEIKPEAKPVAKVEAKPEAKPAVKPAASDEAAKAMAILEGKTPPKAATAAPASDADSNGRFVVQVGAFAEKDKAQQVRLKVERAGMKTYTNVAQTKEGARTRVRVGPFTTRAEAEKAAAKIKTLDLPAAILTL